MTRAPAIREGDDAAELAEEAGALVERGTERLSRGDPEGAREALARASELRPRDPKILGLLGQALYKLGRFDEAAQVYGRLVDESPVEAAPRVNLGLANLKARRYPQAVRQLEIALDLAPGHRKAMNYLGLALLETGEVGQARALFVEAGSEAMVARCDELLARGGASAPPPAPAAAAAPASSTARSARPAAPPAPDAAPALGAPVPLPAAAPETGEGEDAGMTAADVERAAAAALLGPPGLEDGAFLAPPDPDEPEAAPAAPGPASAPSDAAAPPGLLAFALARTAPASDGAPFAVRDGRLAVRVQGEVLVRERGLVAVGGAVRLAPEMKRFRGRSTDRSFGEGERRMLRASGAGRLLFRAGDAQLAAVDLDGESGYFAEEAVAGFEGSIAFENGRVASQLGADLSLVHLRGAGHVLLATRGRLAALPVLPEAPARVALLALVGWTGALTPRLAALTGAEPPGAAHHAGGPLVVELAGEGCVLFDEGEPR